MDELTSRSRGFAEAMVVTICPVLLALALDKVELNRELYGRVVPILMLAIAAAALVTGFCPLLSCYFHERFPNACIRPVPVTKSLAPIASSCLLVLALWFAKLVVSGWAASGIGAFSVSWVVVRTKDYNHYDSVHPTTAQLARTRRFHSILEESHEFLCGVTGILFLGLGSMALEGHQEVIKGDGNGSRPAAIGLLGAPMGTCYIVCALGVCMMLYTLVPPQSYVDVDEIVELTLTLDSIMAAGTFMVLVTIMNNVAGPLAYVLFAPPFLILLHYAARGFRNLYNGGGGSAGGGGQQQQVFKLASLELTKVTFTGFLAVSATVLGNDHSPSLLTNAILLFAAGAIVFGLAWRLMSQIQIRNKLLELETPAELASSVNLVSFSAHFCIVIATVLFAVMAGLAAGKVRSSAPAPAPA